MARIPSAIRSINIEPVCFGFALAASMMYVTRQDFLYQVSRIIVMNSIRMKTHITQIVCTNNYGIAGSNCSELVKVNTTVKHDIEKTTNYYIQACTLIESIIPSMVCLLVGPWTDEYGRKWPIVSEQ